jgi:peptide chain release factor 2
LLEFYQNIVGFMMDAYEYSELLKSLTTKMENIANIVKPESIEARLGEIATLEQDASFWNDAKEAGKVSQEKTKLERVLATYTSANDALSDAVEYYELAQSEHDEETIALLFGEAENLKDQIQGLEVQMMLRGEHDSNNAIVSIHPGAGGTESQDWASMLYRMYLRWAERHNFKVEVLDYQDGEEAGIKDASFIIKGENAYGYLKVENGIHRLVRISPFDSNAKRHTSFSSVMVSPEVDDDIDIEIEEKDLRIDTYRASGAGGQHVNKTESAIRITHIPTNIVVQCQNDRSQHKNKASAMKMLKSRLYELELAKKQVALDGVEKSEIGWGHQIRSYVMQPYQQVKDTRSNQAFSNVDGILDGDLDKMIEGVLIAQTT